MFVLRYFKCSVWNYICAWYCKMFGKIWKKTQWQITRIITWLSEFHIHWWFVIVVVIVLKNLYQAWKDLEEECCSARKILIIKAISQEQMTKEIFVWRLVCACRILVAWKMSTIPYLVSFINSLPNSLWCWLKLILGLTWHRSSPWRTANVGRFGCAKYTVNIRNN